MAGLISLESILDSSGTPASVETASAPAPAPQDHEPADPAEAISPTDPQEGDEPTDGAVVDPETGAADPAADAAPAAPARPGKAGKATPPVAATDDDLPRDVRGLRASNKAERERRKAAEQREQETHQRFAEVEARLREADGQRQRLEAYLQGAQQFAPQGQRPQEQQPQIPDAVTHPEERLAWERQQFAQVLQQRDQHLSQQMHKQVYERSVLLGQQMMRAQNPDYDEMEALATRVAESNPQLRNAILNHPNPAGYTYEVGKRIKLNAEVQQAGGWDAYYTQNMQAQVDAEVERRLAARTADRGAPAPAPAGQRGAANPAPAAPAAHRQPAAAPPQSLARVTSATPGNRAPAWNGPVSLDAIFDKPIGT